MHVYTYMYIHCFFCCRYKHLDKISCSTVWNRQRLRRRSWAVRVRLGDYRWTGVLMCCWRPTSTPTSPWRCDPAVFFLLFPFIMTFHLRNRVSCALSARQQRVRVARAMCVEKTGYKGLGAGATGRQGNRTAKLMGIYGDRAGKQWRTATVAR